MLRRNGMFGYDSTQDTRKQKLLRVAKILGALLVAGIAVFLVTL